MAVSVAFTAQSVVFAQGEEKPFEIFVAADGEQIAYRFEDKAYVWDGTHYTLQNADAFWKAVNEIR